MAANDDPVLALDRLRESLAACTRCGLGKTKNKLVFGSGNPRASLVVVGEAPGAAEDEQGEPFVGPAGQMLDRMLANVLKLDRAEVYVVNVLKCRPPQDRDPKPEEILGCRQVLEAQLMAIRPRAILALGRYATQTLLRTREGVKSLRGRWSTWSGIPVMPTYHPAYLLRLGEPQLSQEKRAVMADLLQVKELLARAPTGS
jgi:DNA polymerase